MRAGPGAGYPPDADLCDGQRMPVAIIYSNIFTCFGKKKTDMDQIAALRERRPGGFRLFIPVPAGITGPMTSPAHIPARPASGGAQLRDLLILMRL
jgi:hypothetical protein